MRFKVACEVAAMEQKQERVLLNHQVFDRFVRIVALFTGDPKVGRTALWRFGWLVALILGFNGMNVVGSYVGRDFMTAVAGRDLDRMLVQTGLYLVVFSVLTVFAVIARYLEESLGLLWREWLTGLCLNRYLAHRCFYRLAVRGEVPNPDQRIADDIKAFTVTALSFALILLNSGFAVIAFSGVLLEISPLLFGVAVAYAAVGSYLTIRLGRPLVRLNYDQLDKEADFRSALIHLRENADPIALLGQECPLRGRLFERLSELVRNFHQIIQVNLRLNFFTTGYNWLIQVIPILVVAPLYFRGEVEFGVVTQAAMAFMTLTSAFSLIVTQFQSISSFAAVIARLDALADALLAAEERATRPAIEVSEDQTQVAYDRLTLRSPRSGRTLVAGLTLAIPYGQAVLVVGDRSAQAALLRATAGIWDEGEGRIVRPALEQMAFLPERPYLPPGTLREALLCGCIAEEIADQDIMDVFALLTVKELVQRFGLDSKQDWPGLLGLAEQQLLAVARVLLLAPRFVFLDRPSSALDPQRVAAVLDLFRQRAISYVVFEDTAGDLEHYDRVLRIDRNGKWQVSSVTGGQLAEKLETGSA
ncbi:MAG: ABC transporter ATP-binding protein/permease [Methylohalobius sp.]|nr:ABC transporter ATP-binding protein/permease [Methylohalobius sp.]